MARTRNLKPAFFKNEDLAECDPVVRLLFAGLWTLADREGRLEYRPKRIRAELFPYDNFDVAGMLDQLAARGFIRLYEVDGQKYLEIPTFLTHQHPHPSEKTSCPHPPEVATAVKNNCKSVTSRENSRQVSEEQGTKPSLYLVPSTSHLAPSESQSRPADAGRSATADAICWDSSEGWQGITDGDREAWRTAYPACDIDQELARADQWLRGNPTKAKRKAWRRFVTGWLSRTQDRGGSKTGQSAATTPKAARRFWRSEFDRQMTDAEYAAAMRQRKTAGGVSLDLARTLTAEVRNAN
jgi:hypothetical protein